AWGGALDAILGGSVFLDPASSQPKGFLTRVYDGNPGQLEEPTGSFLIFDGPRAAFRVSVPPWRTVDRFAFYALEARSRSAASAHLAFEDAAGRSREVTLDRRVVGTRGGLVHVEYRSRSERLAASGGVFRLAYEN